MDSKLLQKICIWLFLLASIFYVCFSLCKPITTLNQISTIYGLNLISEKEIRESLESTNQDHRKFIEINPQALRRYLEKRPLVKKVKIRSLLYPHKHFNIYIQEYEPWAIYEKKIIDQEAKILAQAPDISSECLMKLYEENQKPGGNLIHVQAKKLNPKIIPKIKYIADAIAMHLAPDNQILQIHLDSSQNLILESKKFNLIFGKWNDNIDKKLKKFALIKSKIQEFNLEYIDLTLTNSDVVLGKK